MMVQTSSAIMLPQREKEKLFIYCLEELRLLIERPYEHDALLDRLSAIRNSIENLYESTFIRKR
jgi:hypothetical protein